jgi:hypothetical protein
MVRPWRGNKAQAGTVVTGGSEDLAAAAGDATASGGRVAAVRYRG